MRKLTSLLLTCAAIAAAGCWQRNHPKDAADVPLTSPTESVSPATVAPTAAHQAPPARGEAAISPASAPVPPPAAASPPGPSQVVAGPMLQVNGRFFTVDDILTAAGMDLGRIPTALPEAEFRRRVEGVLTDTIRRRVSQELALPQAKKVLTEEQIKLIDQEVADTRDEMVLRNGGSKKKLEMDLAAQGTTLQAVLDEYRTDLTVRSFLRMKFVPAVSISRSMLWDYYRRNREQFISPAKVQMQTISAPLSAFLAEGTGQPTPAERSAAAEKARERIEQARLALAAGEDFAAVAQRYSFDAKAAGGGLWPPMQAGSFRFEEVEKAAFAQPKGQVSDAIETPDGCFIVKTVDVQEGSVVTFEQAQEGIERTLRDQQSAKLYNDYYQELLKGAMIAQSEDFMPTAVERAVLRYRGK